jgi:DNA polymerase III subunit delta
VLYPRSVNAAAAIAQAKRGPLLPVYLVAGDERFLRDQVVAALRTASLGAGIAAFNEDKFTAGEAAAEKVIAAARTVPMMGPKRFVLVRNAERWDATGGAGEGESAFDQLAAYAQAPVDSTCMVLVFDKLDGRRKLATIAKKQGFLVECGVLDRGALPGWIMEKCAEKGHAVDREVADLLAEIAGPELAYVSDAVERLSLYAGANQPITEDAVTECIARVRTADTWALVDAVGARDLARALKVLADAYDPRDRGLPLLGALAWSIRQLAKFHAAQSAGASVDEAGRRAGVYPSFRARELARKTRGLRAKDVERWLLVLAETDLALKGSRRPPEAILEDALTKLCKR